jgi:ABC-2 type transport system ATP-binding protein
MIKIENLKKSFGETVACDIPQLTIGDGEIIGLVGNNGAGKTTLFRMLLDLLKPDDGEVLYSIPSSFGSGQGVATSINPAQSEEWKQFTGAYIDEGFLIDYLTPEEYFQFLSKITGITDTDERLSHYERLAGGEIFGQKKLIRNLSAGNKQKVGIMAALFNEPSIVILDEPFNFLDPSSQNILKQELSAYQRRTGATLLVSSHNLQHTIDISTRIVLLEKGHVIMDGADREELENYFNLGMNVIQP